MSRVNIAAGKVLDAACLAVLEQCAETAGVKAIVTSTSRTPYEQAKAMYANCKAKRSAKYAAPGAAVVAVYDRSSHMPAQIVIERMLDEIMRQGPQRVSNHCLPADAPIWVVDFGSFDEPGMRRFISALQAHPRVTKVLHPFDKKRYDPVIHAEIRKAA